jgi:HPt (histidine-containing phosphotransfer) domain-containing protein
MYSLYKGSVFAFPAVHCYICIGRSVPVAVINFRTIACDPVISLSEGYLTSDDSSAESRLLSRLNELKAETDPEFVSELIEIFIKDTPVQIRDISNALEKKNIDGLISSAHKLKGASLNLGAERLGTLCLELERLGNSGGSIPPGTDTREIESEFERIKPILLQFK